mmetsp:Transcript_23108/g.37552  ORF Transcript_23108/g.37552 Transcript_23108/m.37552 type:complete len:259 (-) Transcript_23108:259-1035(-)
MTMNGTHANDQKTKIPQQNEWPCIPCNDLLHIDGITGDLVLVGEWDATIGGFGMTEIQLVGRRRGRRGCRCVGTGTGGRTVAIGAVVTKAGTNVEDISIFVIEEGWGRCVIAAAVAVALRGRRRRRRRRWFHHHGLLQNSRLLHGGRSEFIFPPQRSIRPQESSSSLSSLATSIAAVVVLMVICIGRNRRDSFCFRRRGRSIVENVSISSIIVVVVVIVITFVFHKIQTTSLRINRHCFHIPRRANLRVPFARHWRGK